ncbi:MAG TPA: TIGR03067 domain-containing protein [Bryobacteraceae bacterium]|nr:TIGR03067 domain-containing protein [Bryobacteraceae bacterium]
MQRRLPARPNLEHLRTQAKALLAKLREGDAEAARTFSKYLPEAATLPPEEVRARGFRLADAQAAIARKSGFAAWPGLARHVDRLRSMEGTWGFRSLEVDGSAVPAGMLTGSSLLIDGDRFRMESPEATYEGIFTIDVEPVPHRIDIDFVEGPEAGNRCEGLFDLDGDRFRLCLGLVGSKRPLGFATTPGSGHALEELVRIDHARPPAVDGGTAPPSVTKPAAVRAEGDFEAVLTPTLQRLQGEWLPLELITSGTPLQANWLPFGSRTNFGIETKVVFGGQTQVHAKVRFHESASPLEVDYYNLLGKAKGTLSLGLFRWDGEEAVYCMAAPGAPRPSDFTCDKGSGRIFSRWKRK